MGTRLRLGACALILGLCPLTAFSGDGVREISQTCANAGCFPGDAAGFPVTISSPGSYVLTENLGVTASVTPAPNGIEVRSDDVSIDLNGFAIRCVRTIQPAGPCKGQAGAGDAIEIVSGRNARISNGTVRDFPQHGINAALATTSYSVDAVRAINNGMNGIDSSGNAQILRSFATDNAQYGILLRAGAALVLDAFTNGNGTAGIRDAASDEAIGRSQFRDGTSAITATDLVECILDGVTQVCP